MIALSGSCKICVEYFEYAMNMILYQRNIYPHEMFSMVRKYGIHLLKTDDDQLGKYLNAILIKVKDWIEQKYLEKLVLCIIDQSTMETVEQWEFSIAIEDTQLEERDICKNIQYILKQIISSCTTLPLLEGPHTIHVLCHTKDEVIPEQWITSHSHDIPGAESIALKSFNTNSHLIGTKVHFK